MHKAVVANHRGVQCNHRATELSNAIAAIDKKVYNAIAAIDKKGMGTFSTIGAIDKKGIIQSPRSPRRPAGRQTVF